MQNDFLPPARIKEFRPIPGVVTIVHLNGFSAGMRYAIYRRTQGIPDSFQKKVDEALSRMPNHEEERFSNVRFALELLSGQLEVITSNLHFKKEVNKSIYTLYMCIRVCVCVCLLLQEKERDVEDLNDILFGDTE